MKKVFYESWIAKHLLINDCTTVGKTTMPTGCFHSKEKLG